MDARKKKVLTVLCIGSVILVWRVYDIITKYALGGPAPAAAAAPAAEPSLPPAGPVALDAAMKTLLAEQERIAAQDWGRDPFAAVPWEEDSGDEAASTVRHPDATPPAAPSIRLTGVSRSGDRWLAAVGGKIVRIGDVLNETYRVVKIDRHSITLASRGWLFTYRMGSERAGIRPRKEEPR